MMKTGIKGRRTTVVTEELTADKIGSGLVPVFATPMMVALMEQTCNESVEPYLNEGECTVGTRLEINHTAATAVGMHATCESELTAVDGRRLTFHVTVHDEAGQVGDGVHERCVVDRMRFQQKAEGRAAAAKTGVA